MSSPPSLLFLLAGLAGRSPAVPALAGALGAAGLAGRSPAVPALAGALGAAGLAAGCAGTRAIAIDSEPPARILENSETACAKTPCLWTFSRETCGLYDSSRGYFRLVAVADDGRKLSSPMLKTCGVEKGTKLSFRFSSKTGTDDCLVTVSAGGKESRFPGCGAPSPARRR